MPANTTHIPRSNVCRIQTAASYRDTVSALRAVYADVELLTADDAFDGTAAFVTPVTTEAAVRDALASIGTITSLLRVMPQ